MRWTRVLGMLVFTLVLSPAASAAYEGWSYQPSPDSYDTSAQVQAVSCSSPDACTAVGVQDSSPETFAARWDGSSWTMQSTPTIGAAAGDVSCPTASDCTAVGGVAERWNGDSWRLQSTPDFRHSKSSSLEHVSCTSASACTALGTIETRNRAGSITGNVPFAERWNGSHWTIQNIRKAGPKHYPTVEGLSCGSARACTVVGGVGNPQYGPGHPEHRSDAVVEHWNGKRWSVQPTPKPVDAFLFAVSCTSARACIAIGETRGNPRAERWNGRHWSILPPPASVLSSLSCSSARACTAVASHTSAERWNGRGWTIQGSSDSTDWIVDVSCPWTSFCMAGGQTSGGSYGFSLIETWTG